MLSGRQYSRMESWSGVAILLCLLAVALGVFLRQYSFNPAVLVARHAAPQPSPPPGSQGDFASLPPELEQLGAPESFTPENLYRKIDGRAELYLTAGFVRLHCQRFALKDAPDQWFEWFVYDMGGALQAFSVFSTQRRAEGQPLDLTEFGYRTKNALYFVSGNNYIEAIASTANEPLINAMLSLAGGYVAARPAAAGLPGMDLLPKENLVPATCTLESSDAFGFDQFKDVFTAQYRLDGAEVMAFVTSCPSAAAAVALRDAYRSFLLANGGKEVASQTGGAPAKGIEIFGTIEMVFSEGNCVAGVHAAPAVAPAEQLARRLREHLGSDNSATSGKAGGTPGGTP